MAYNSRWGKTTDPLRHVSRQGSSVASATRGTVIPSRRIFGGWTTDTGNNCRLGDGKLRSATVYDYWETSAGATHRPQILRSFPDLRRLIRRAARP